MRRAPDAATDDGPRLGRSWRSLAALARLLVETLIEFAVLPFHLLRFALARKRLRRDMERLLREEGERRA